MQGKLTERETATLNLVKNGYENPEIAEELYISRSTVKVYVSSLLEKLGARNRTHAVYIAFKNGIID